MDRRRAAAVTAAAVAAAGIVAGAALETPLVETEPVPLVEELPEEDGDAAERPRVRRPADGVRARLMEIPETVRAFLAGVPLWSAGQALLAGAAALLPGVVDAVSAMLGWILAGAVAVAVLGASVKAALPDVPVKRILRPRNVLPLLGATALLAVLDVALCSVAEIGFPHWVWHAGAGAALAAVCAGTIRREKRLALEEAEQEAEDAFPGRTAVEEAARRLADTVCPRRFS